MCVLECSIFQVIGADLHFKIQHYKSKRNKKTVIIETNTWDIEKLGTDLCVSMYVTSNSKKYMLIHYFECGSTRMEKMA